MSSKEFNCHSTDLKTLVINGLQVGEQLQLSLSNYSPALLDDVGSPEDEEACDLHHRHPHLLPVLRKPFVLPRNLLLIPVIIAAQELSFTSVL